jgi:hypothetical protein
MQPHRKQICSATQTGGKNDDAVFTRTGALGALRQLRPRTLPPCLCARICGSASSDCTEAWEGERPAWRVRRAAVKRQIHPQRLWQQSRVDECPSCHRYISVWCGHRLGPGCRKDFGSLPGTELPGSLGPYTCPAQHR